MQKIYIVIPQFLVTDELVQLAHDMIKSVRDSSDAFIISVDDSGEYKKADGADEVLAMSDKVITNKQNSGFATTCNNGFRWIFERESVDNCYIVCANNDILINKKTLPALTEPFDLFPNVAITGIVSTKEKLWEGQPLEMMDWGEITEGGLLRDRMQDGGLWCSNKEVLQKIGIFDEKFVRGGYEDVDLFLRARDTFSMQLIMSGRAAYWHKQGATRWNSEIAGAVNNFGIESKRIEDKNLEYFISKWLFNPHQRQIWFDKIIFKA